MNGGKPRNTSVKMQRIYSCVRVLYADNRYCEVVCGKKEKEEAERNKKVRKGDGNKERKRRKETEK
jgi:hypothetical protein